MNTLNQELLKRGSVFMDHRLKHGISLTGGGRLVPLELPHHQAPPPLLPLSQPASGVPCMHME